MADEVRNKSILDRIPAGRWGDASDLGGAAVILSSSTANYVQGHILAVDGCWLAR
jgi:2-deoxy-D-gluconate 3-dehydrogenase